MFYCWEIRKYHRQNICDLKVLIGSHCRRRLMSIIARKILQRIFGNHVSFLGQCIYYLASISKCSVMRSTIFLLCSLTMSIIYLWIFVILDDDCDLPHTPMVFPLQLSSPALPQSSPTLRHTNIWWPPPPSRTSLRPSWRSSWRCSRALRQVWGKPLSIPRYCQHSLQMLKYFEVNTSTQSLLMVMSASHTLCPNGLFY